MLSVSARRSPNPYAHVALIGFGEVGAFLLSAAQALDEGDTWSVCFPGHAPSAVTRAKLASANVQPADAPSAIAAAGLVVAAVTPSGAVTTALRTAPHLARGSVYLDMNSIGGDASADIQAIVSAAGAAFAKAAILGPVLVTGTRTPIAIGGAGAYEATVALARLGFVDLSSHADATVPTDVKLLWSVVSKGLTALYAEALVPAHRLGLATPLLHLLRSQLGFVGSDEMVTRLLMSNVHAGARRMEEVAAAERIVASTGVAPHTPAATRHWLARLARLAPALERDALDGRAPATAAASVDWLARALHDNDGVANAGAQCKADGGLAGAGN